ncbi:hypothetical protein [Ktedonospora formicarum]|nr:hypothetical protein [Ktedonospora formicarum]
MPGESQEGQRIVSSIQEHVAQVRRLLGDALPARALFERYRPEREWFLQPDCAEDIHGIDHEARVLIWQELLARLLIKGGAALDQEALRWAAATHDTQRVSHGIDFPHGQRAAAWVKRHLLHRIPVDSLDTVLYLNIWHVPFDDQAPEMTPELAVFKDADSLDRVRIDDLNARYLRCHYSQTLLQYLAQELFDRSEAKRWSEGYATFDCVCAAAMDMGLIRPD